jgi:hypothetical protein
MAVRRRADAVETTGSEAVPPHLETTMRLLVRHQWVRDQDNPRITILNGPVRSGLALWQRWLDLTGRSNAAHPVIEQPAGADAPWLDRTARQAIELAVSSPRQPIAVTVAPSLLERWLAGRRDRVAAAVKEGIVLVPAAAGVRRRPEPVPPPRRAPPRKARSFAELALFEALEQTPGTAGRFELNGLLSIDFGGRPAEVDLLSRADDIAIEIDGYYHFTDAEGYRRDRRKDVALQAHGYAVLRFLSEDVRTDPGAAVRMVLEVMGKRRRRGRGQR